jgi:hypothetical protein
MPFFPGQERARITVSCAGPVTGTFPAPIPSIAHFLMQLFAGRLIYLYLTIFDPADP